MHRGFAMHKSRLGCIVIDRRTDNLDAAARFWAETLGLAVKDDRRDPLYRVLEGPDGEVKALVDKVDHDPRVHLDIETDDQEAEAVRLEGLGAKRIAAIKNWIVMEAPSGHRFCLVNPQRPDFRENATEWA